jgi:hypothetical protein
MKAQLLRYTNNLKAQLLRYTNLKAQLLRYTNNLKAPEAALYKSERASNRRYKYGSASLALYKY